MAELDTSQGGGKKHGKGGKRSKKMSTRVDLTPMVDLAFLLVTFFMLTTTFSKPQTMEINMPVKDKTAKADEGQAVKESKAVTIILDTNNVVWYYEGITDPELKKTDFSKAGIRDILLTKDKQKNHEMVVLIKATSKATYKNVVDILDEMNITNIKRFALVDIQPFDLTLIQNFK
jgi:biopolymer transport protein ExbD